MTDQKSKENQMLGMFRSYSLLLIVFLVFVGASSTIAAEHVAKQPENQVEEQAREVVGRFVNYLANLKQLRVTAEFGFDVLQETGQMIEFGSHQEITVQRPDHFRINLSRRDGIQGLVVYDGKEIVLSDPDQAVYAKVPFKGEIDDAFDFLGEELQRPVPLRDLFASDLRDIMIEKIDAALYLGESTVGGVLCDHLALRNDSSDFQLWVAQGDEPLLQRIIITYKNEEGQPQFWAQFLKWELSPEITDKDFSYVPPQGAERIPFAVLDEEIPEQGDQP
jgi:hypothetical protein